MPDFSYGQVQRVSQVQKQILSQKQIQALNLLAMNSQDLSAEIYKAVDANPALEVVNDSSVPDVPARVSSSLPGDNTRIGSVTASGIEKAEKYQEAYENAADTRETLQDHLLFQLNVMKLSSAEKALGEALIRNLDENGWHILAPVSLLDKSRSEQNQKMLGKVVDIVQRLDPEGTCCNNMEESLLVQAEIRGDAPPLALFILDGHIDVLYSNDSTPDIDRICRKLKKLKDERSKLMFAAASGQDESDITSDDVKRAIAFISRLNPHPAQGFGRSASQYVHPDVLITKVDGEMRSFDPLKEMLVPCGENSYYQIALANDFLPEVRIARGLEGAGYKGLKKNITAARQFLENLAYRKSIIIRACGIIVRIQEKFFSLSGKGYLEPLTQRSLAEELGVHESTVSRMANEKYIQSPWGQLFPVKYFFTNTQDKVKFAIKQILENQAAGVKPLSDRAVAELLEKQGVHAARRTVAKYRSALNIETSYFRKN
ncbi:MAG: RNA polymerase factor sigma-54 [Treponema sp.]|nr:RNA polymerase factor sigma-54 [Treponema sp.]